MNTITVVGRVGSLEKSELRTVGNDAKQVFEFSVASDDGYSDEPDWFSVETWGKQAQAQDKYLEQGQQVTIFGSMSEQKWKTGDGDPRSKWVLKADTISWGEKSRKAAPSN